MKNTKKVFFFEMEDSQKKTQKIENEKKHKKRKNTMKQKKREDPQKKTFKKQIFFQTQKNEKNWRDKN